MDEENNSVTNEKTQTENIDNKNESIENNAVINQTSSEDDVSKVKIRTILKQRFKNLKPGLRLSIPIILVAIICFIGGMMTDRAIIWNKAGKAIKDRPGISRRMQKDPFNNKQFKNKNNTLPGKNNNNNGNSNNQNNG